MRKKKKVIKIKKNKNNVGFFHYWFSWVEFDFFCFILFCLLYLSNSDDMLHVQICFAKVLVSQKAYKNILPSL